LFSKYRGHKFDLFGRPMTLIFDLLTPQVERFIPLPTPVNHLCQFAAKSPHWFSKYWAHKTG